MAKTTLTHEQEKALKAGGFQADFPEWAHENAHIVRAFFSSADAVAQYRAYYSARTITEHLRHESIVRDKGSEWKINNNRTPDLARLYEAVRRNGLFSFRGR